VQFATPAARAPPVQGSQDESPEVLRARAAAAERERQQREREAEQERVAREQRDAARRLRDAQ
jgi:hypothetical protein